MQLIGFFGNQIFFQVSVCLTFRIIFLFILIHILKGIDQIMGIRVLWDCEFVTVDETHILAMPMALKVACKRFNVDQ